MLWGERRGNRTIVAINRTMECPMPRQLNDLSRSLVALEQDATLIALIEMGQSSWLVAGLVPGIGRQPLKKLTTDQHALLQLLHSWRKEANEAGHVIKRITVAYEAGRDGFWLARWLRAREIEAYVIHQSSVPVSREHRRAKTDRLDTELLKRAFLDWLRGEPKHCSMAAIPTVGDEDARRPSRERETLVKETTRLVNRMKANLARLGIRGFRPHLAQAARQLQTLQTPEGAALPANTLAELRRDMDRLRFVKQQIKQIEAARVERLEREPAEQRHAMVRLLGRVVGIGVETADMLVHEVVRAQAARSQGGRAVRRSNGCTRRERHQATRAGACQSGQCACAPRDDPARLASSSASKGQRAGSVVSARTADARGRTRKIMIAALARKLLIALWRVMTTGEAPAGLLIRPAA
jgi:transposase